MALKSLLFISLLLEVMVAAPAVAQLGLGNLLGLINIQGTLFCTANGGANSSIVSTPVFPSEFDVPRAIVIQVLIRVPIFHN